MHRSLEQFDEAVDRAFGRLRGRRGADWVAYAASEAADFSIAWHIVGAAMAIASPSRRADSVRLAATLGVESLLVNGLIKRWSKRERPPMLANRAYEVRRPATTSFPSGHASSAAVAAVLLSSAMPRLKPVWLVLAATVAASRVHNRMHHPTDVAAGAALGTVIGRVAKCVWPLR